MLLLRKPLMEEFPTTVTVESIYFSNHDALRILIEKNNISLFSNCFTKKEEFNGFLDLLEYDLN